MAIKVKSATQASEKYAVRAQAASQDYAQQAAAAGEEWSSRTQAADANFFQSVSQPNVQRRFRAGVQRAGAQKFTRGVSEKGSIRYGPGVQAGTADYTSGVEPYLSTIAALTLSPRRPRGDPSNYQRGQQVGNALHAKRIALLGGMA